MRKYLKIIVILLFTGLLMNSGALAQLNMDQLRQRFVEELAKTDRVIEQARMVISQSNTAYDSEYLKIATRQANYLLDEAIRRQKLASTFQNAAHLAGLKTGGKITLEARELAWKAIMVKRRVEGKVEENENTVLRQLEKTDNLVERIKDHAPAGINNRLKSAFRSALDSQRRAWEHYRERALRAALKLSRQAEKSLIKLGERLRSEKTDNRRLQNQIMQTEQRLEQLRLEIQECDSDEARRLLEQANESLKKCLGLLNKSQIKQAWNGLRKTQRLLQKISRLCSDKESLERVIVNLRARIERAFDSITGTGITVAVRLLESARQHLRDAERFCDKGNSEACAASVKAAQMNLRKAIKLAGK